jgi:hypothetical protein
MTVSNTNEDENNESWGICGGCGILMMNSKVELFDVALRCVGAALHMPGNTIHTTSETILLATRCTFSNSQFGAIVSGELTSAKVTDCVFHDHEIEGIVGDDNATIHLHGEATAIHSNYCGIYADHSAKVLIHLPSHHNTLYNNSQDRNTDGGATITNVED